MARPSRFEATGGLIGTYMTDICRHATRRGIAVEITMKDLSEQWARQGAKCALTGWDLTLKRTARDWQATASVDRIDSSLGYVPGNVQFVHKDVNASKWDHDESRFFEICRAVAAYKEETKRLREGSRPWLKE
jgi:hypothetical protein